MKPFRVVSRNKYQEHKGLGFVFVNDVIYIDRLSICPIKIELDDNLNPVISEVDKIPCKPMRLDDYKHIKEMEKVSKLNPIKYK